MSNWSFYDPETGLFLRSKLSVTNDSLVATNTPAGSIAICGDYDHLSQRVDIQTGTVVDWQPTQPDEHHQWNDQARRWELTPEAVAAAQKHDAALASIQRLEAGQPRAIRENALGQTGARQRLAQLDAQIESLRGQLLANPPRLKRSSIEI